LGILDLSGKDKGDKKMAQRKAVEAKCGHYVAVEINYGEIARIKNSQIKQAKENLCRECR